jgi:hypothetical protein
MTIDSDQAREVTCPSCLACVPINRPVPILPLGYAAPRDDVDAELRRDEHTLIIGIVAFALAATITLLAIKFKSQVSVPNTYVFGWVGFLTAVVALRRIPRQAEKRHAARAGVPIVTKSPAQRAGSVVLLAVWGAFLAILSIGMAAAALVVILIIACSGSKGRW